MGSGGIYHASCRFFKAMTHHEKMTLTFTSVLLSVDLTKSEVEEREKKARVGAIYF